VVGGVLATNDADLHERLRFIQNGLGAVPSPFDCYLALRGLKTLHLRMDAHARNALAVAQALEAHPMVARVAYPGLPSHPQHRLAQRQTTGHGGMVTFWIKGGLPEVSHGKHDWRVRLAIWMAVKIFEIKTFENVPPPSSQFFSYHNIRSELSSHHEKDLIPSTTTK
jgi:O-acetylhomoserine/O-acetylserine sulfhydrylase-like pyridoxal-dependent enzyme